MRAKRAIKKLLSDQVAGLRCSWLVAVIACVLMVAVFAWGTAYKLSLYQNGPEFPHVKMSAGDGPQKRALTSMTILVAAVLPWLLALIQRQAASSRRRVDLVRVRPVTAVSNPSLYFRPPPRNRR